jgi:hypothetical protein
MFHIPPLPQLERVPEPKPLKRSPVAGYDVKTLKRQVEFLQAEITEREGVHKQVHAQNEEMWEYIKDLIRSSHDNADRMKDYCSQLHSEVTTMTAERKELAEKVSLARDSKTLLQQIHKNLGHAKFSKEEMEHIRDQAEAAFMAARKENEILEDSLQNKVKEMQMMRWKIDENENREQYDAMLVAADEFRQTNKIVLRNALHRFMDGIGARMRISGIGARIQHNTRRHLLRTHFALYRGFMGRKAVMRRAQLRRDAEALQYNFLKLKLNNVLAKVQAKARRRVLLNRTFGTWKAGHTARKFDKWSVTVVSAFQDRKALRKFFNGWKQEVTFLHWHSRQVADLEWTAVRHFAKKVMAAWRAVLPECRAHDRLQTMAIGLYQRRRMFHEWKRICTAAWGRRGHLLLRFFKNLRRMVETEMIIEHTTAQAGRAFMKLSWRRWRANLVRSRRERLAKYTVHSAQRYLSKNRRGVQHMFKQLLLNSITSKRALTSKRAAQVCSVTYMKSQALNWWFHNSQSRVRRRADTRYRLLHLGVTSWQTFTSISSKFHAKAGAIARHHREQKLQNFRRQCLTTWHTNAHRSRSLRSLKAFVSQKHAVEITRRLYLAWRVEWTRKIFWALKEQKIETARNMALADIKRSEIEDLKKNHVELQDMVTVQEGKLRDMEAQRDDKEKEMLDYMSACEARNEEKRQLEIEVEALMKELKHSEVERKKLRATEAMLLAQGQREKAMLEEKKANAEQILGMLKAESKQLQHDAIIAKKQSDHVSKKAEKSLAHNQKVLQERVVRQRELQELLEQRRDESQELLRERDTLQDELEAVAKKLRAVVGRDPAHLVEEQNTLRAKNSELLEVVSSANLAEARVSELKRIVEEMEENFPENY